MTERTPLDRVDEILHHLGDGTYPDTTEGRAAMVRAARQARVELAAHRESLAGPMLAAVRADLDRLDVESVPGGQTHRATVLWLADVIDKRGTDDGPSVTAKLADQLTKVMQVLTRTSGGDGGDGFDRWQDDISEPVVQP